MRLFSHSSCRTLIERDLGFVSLSVLLVGSGTDAEIKAIRVGTHQSAYRRKVISEWLGCPATRSERRSCVKVEVAVLGYRP